MLLKIVLTFVFHALYGTGPSPRSLTLRRNEFVSKKRRCMRDRMRKP
ncbi:hypothetical protein HMPREF0762_00159 [Slackia exigua ATCC 700122]|uniref:Uncharacterized protein n=1 Tax=Slackia exigua (strain ATCC 700122 / DSM 15923 / CIP 105133 / JCM 11022 / KCTC 5966 / S-7) TaxID=649764 RepID=D0WEC9_SLAES|nr:hypothetical protein HMPREF0762_00159 [Slackia exigua ATCC 700122]